MNKKQSKFKYFIKSIYKPFFINFGDKRYLMPGWILVNESITLDDVKYESLYESKKIKQ